MRSVLQRRAVAAALAIAISTGMPWLDLRAQEIASDSKLEEVVVTSRKRAESVLDVPISIDTVTAAQIEDLNLKTMTDIAKYTPGMFYTNYEANRADRLGSSYVIRAISLNSFNNFSDAALLFVDGAPVVSGNMPGIDDIERVEVLKGPQAAYFGRNTFAGAISVTTRDPGDTWEGRASAESSSYHGSDLSLSVDGPVIPGKVLARLSAEAQTTGGQYANWLNSSDRLGGQTTDSFALTLKVTPIEGLQGKFGVNYYTYDDEPGAQARLIGDSFNCDPGNTGTNTWYCGVAPRIQPNQINYNFELTPQYRQEVFPTSIFGGNGIDDHPGVQSNNWHIYGRVDYELPLGITLESITAWDRTESAVITDEWYDPNYVNPFDTGPWNWLYLIEEYKADFSQELRLTSAKADRLRWTVGGNFLDLKADVGHVAGITPLGTPLGGPFGPVNYAGTVGGSKTYAGFGGIYYDLIKSLELGVEARYQSDQVTNQVPVVSGSADLTGTFNSFSPRVTLKYKVTPDTSVYALYARGTRPGAFNSLLYPNSTANGTPISAAQDAQITQITGAHIDVKEETLDNYEIGIKSQALDGRLFATLDGYWGKINNQQVQDAVFIPGTLIISDVLVNRGETRLDGIEGEINFQVTEGLRLSAAYALNNTRILSGPDTTVAPLRGCTNAQTYSDPACSDVDGNHLPNAPRQQGNVGASFTQPINAAVKWYASGEYLYIGTKYAETANLLQTGAQELVNLRVGLTGATWRIEAWGRNINNNKTPELVSVAANYNTLFTGGNINAIEEALPQKPVYGVRVNYRF